MSVQEQVRPGPPAPVPPGPSPGPGARPAPHSSLGQIVCSVALIGVGVLLAVDLVGVRVPGSGYVAVPLAIVGAGLVVGAWYGRARGLIALGAILSVALAIVGVSENVNITGGARNVTWQPTGIEQLEDSYDLGIGNARVDLSRVDFTGRSEEIEARVGVGTLEIIVPPTVDVEVRAAVDVGNADVFGIRWDGIGQSRRTVADDGTDGPGGGELVVRASVDVGNLEVQR